MEEILQKRIRGKTLIIGVGNILRGDDGFGPLLLQRLEDKVEAELLDTGEVPESYLGRIINSRPDTIVVVDAVLLQAEPGSLAIIEIPDLTGTSTSTHRLSLAFFMKFVREETGADVFLLGVQPGTLDLGAAMSPPVRASLELLAEYLTTFLGKNEKVVIANA